MASVLRQVVGTGWQGRTLFFFASGDRLLSSEQEAATTSPVDSSFFLAVQLLLLSWLLLQGVFPGKLRLLGAELSAVCRVGEFLHLLATTGHSSSLLDQLL